MKSRRTLQAGIKYRGTACCVDMMLNVPGEGGNGEYLPVKVGIGHSVTWKRTYLSFFYAFLPTPPFHTVALSGYFCLGAMKPSDIGVTEHWMSHQSGIFNSSMSWEENNYACPGVTFASSFIEKADDTGSFVMSYGVNDCYSRSIVIPKEKVEMLLTPSTMFQNKSFYASAVTTLTEE